LNSEVRKSIKLIFGVGSLILISAFFLEQVPKSNLSINDGKFFWIQSRVYDSKPATVDYLFLGSSYSFSGIDSNQLSGLLGGARVWNLGVNWGEPEISYYLLRHVLERHKVKNVFLETRYFEDTFRHRYVNWLISTQDIPKKVAYEFSVVKKSDVLSYSYVFKEPLNRTAEHIASIAVKPYVAWMDQFYFRSLWEPKKFRFHETSNGHESAESQNEYFNRMEMTKSPEPIQMHSDEFPRGSHVDYYTRQIVSLCQKKGIKLSFLFLPIYNGKVPSQSFFTYYHSKAPFLIPDFRSFRHPKFWKDYLHVYGEGTRRLTQAISELIQKGPANSPLYHWYETKPVS